MRKFQLYAIHKNHKVLITSFDNSYISLNGILITNLAAFAPKYLIFVESLLLLILKRGESWFNLL